MWTDYPPKKELNMWQKANGSNAMKNKTWHETQKNRNRTRNLEVFTLPHSFRAVLLGNSHICSECSISEVRANFRNSSEFFRAYSDQFRATGRNHSDYVGYDHNLFRANS